MENARGRCGSQGSYFQNTPKNVYLANFCFIYIIIKYKSTIQNVNLQRGAYHKPHSGACRRQDSPKLNIQGHNGYVDSTKNWRYNHRRLIYTGRVKTLSLGICFKYFKSFSFFNISYGRFNDQFVADFIVYIATKHKQIS